MFVCALSRFKKPVFILTGTQIATRAGENPEDRKTKTEVRPRTEVRQNSFSLTNWLVRCMPVLDGGLTALHLQISQPKKGIRWLQNVILIESTLTRSSEPAGCASFSLQW